jgi:molybdopterin-guanine dinucleotide biosynthesis protein A
MTGDFLIWLAQLAAKGGELAFVPEAQGRRQPLCAVYRRAAKSVIEQALTMGDFKVGHIFSLIPTRCVQEVELLAAGFSSDIFCNVNTREDYETVRNMQKQGLPPFSESHGQ